MGKGSETMTKLLVVEDNDKIRDIMRRHLALKGFEVVLAADGEAGLALATSEAPDLIIMDLSLPKLDGWEATRRLKAAPATDAIPIIALTAHAMADDREKALAAGCDDYEPKPIEMERLLYKIGQLLDGRDT